MMEGEPASRGACPRASPPVACPSLQSHIPLVVVASLLRPCPPLGAPPYSQRPKGGGYPRATAGLLAHRDPGTL